MGLLNIRRYSNANSGCRPGCGCLIFILLALLAGYVMMTIFGGGLSQITLPGGDQIEIPRSGNGNSTDDGSTYRRGNSGSGSGSGSDNSIDFDNKLRKGLPDEDSDESGNHSMDV